MSESCPVCDSEFEQTADESAAREVAHHLVAESRNDPQHRTWVNENTTLGNVSEIADVLEG